MLRIRHLIRQMTSICHREADEVTPSQMAQNYRAQKNTTPQTENDVNISNHSLAYVTFFTKKRDIEHPFII